MRIASRPRRRAYGVLVAAVALLVTLQAPLGASASILVRISRDPFHSKNSAHATQVEAAAYANGSTISSAYQSGRFTDGGANDIGWATSTDGGATWKHGFLKGTTIYENGSYARISDPAIVYDAKHGTWLIEALPLLGPGEGTGVVVSRSSDALTWSTPVTVTNDSGTDKTWINCDNNSSSPYYGHCYAEWDNFGNGDLLQISTSTDGGKTWSAPATTGNSATGTGAQPQVQPDGTVIVPADDAFESNIIAFKSTNGGKSWSATTAVNSIQRSPIGGGLRSPDLLTSAIDASGKVYVAWYDCRFESNCSANDIVMVSSTDGTTWTSPVRIPIDAKGSGVDHFLMSLAIKKGTSGSSAVLGLTYYYYPQASCTKCKLYAGYVSSTDGGAHWTSPTQLTGPLDLGWLAPTTQGPMVGDYSATAFVGSKGFSVIASAAQKSKNNLYHESIYSSTGLEPQAGTLPVDSAVLTNLSTAPALTSPALNN